MVKFICAAVVILISASAISLGIFVGFFAKTSLLVGLMLLLVGGLAIALLFDVQALSPYRKQLLWVVGLGYGLTAIVAAPDGGAVTGMEWLSIFTGLIEGGISVLCLRAVHKRRAPPLVQAQQV